MTIQVWGCSLAMLCKRACHSFDIDNKLCYYMINGKAEIEESTNTIVDTSTSPRPDRNEPSHSVSMGLSRWFAYLSLAGPATSYQRGRPEQISGEVVRALT
jgi:hypothetical protein